MASDTDTSSHIRLPARAVWQRYGVTDRTLDRWLRRPDLRFPQPVAIILKRRYWSLAALEQWERNRAASGKGGAR